MSLPYPFQLQMASMRRPSLSSRRGGWGHPQRKVTCAPLRVLLYALSWGRLPGDPVHEMRSVRTQRRCNLVFGLLRQRAIFLFAVAKDRAVSGARHRSSLIGSRSRASAGYDPLGVLPTSRIAVLHPVFQAASSPRVPADRALRKGSYASPVIQSLCKRAPRAYGRDRHYGPFLGVLGAT